MKNVYTQSAQHAPVSAQGTTPPSAPLLRWPRQALLLLALLLCGGQVFAADSSSGPIIYVNISAAPGGDGSSWGTAYNDLQAALAAATTGSSTQIWVATGIYKPTTGADRNATFQLKNGVALYGGFAGTETMLSARNWADNVTILSGDIGTVNVTSDNSYHVVTGSSTNFTAVLDGFTITGGNANSKLSK